MRALALLPMVTLFGLSSAAAQVTTAPRALGLPEVPSLRPDPSGHRVELSNGLVGYVAEDRSAPLVTVTAFVNAGYADGPDGAAEALAHAYRTRGPAEMAETDFRQMLRDMTADYRVVLGPEHMEITLDVPSGDGPAALSLLGRLVREKRYDRLLEIMSKLKDSDWKLLIVGDGYQRNMVEMMIDDLDLYDRVILAGEQKEVDRYFSESSIYVLTSDIEGFPNALCEAMAHGLACISYDCVAGPGDIIQDGVNGILVEEDDSERFVRELDLLIADPKLRVRLGREAEKIRSELQVNRIFEQYLDFILWNND